MLSYGTFQLYRFRWIEGLTKKERLRKNGQWDEVKMQGNPAAHILNEESVSKKAGHRLCQMLLMTGIRWGLRMWSLAFGKKEEIMDLGQETLRMIDSSGIRSNENRT